MGFEPTRAEHIGLAAQRLNHSATSSGDWQWVKYTNTIEVHNLVSNDHENLHICYSNSIVLVLLGVVETNAGCNPVTLSFGLLRFIFDLNHRAARFKSTYGTYQHSANGVLLYQFGWFGLLDIGRLF